MPAGTRHDDPRIKKLPPLELAPSTKINPATQTTLDAKADTATMQAGLNTKQTSWEMQSGRYAYLSATVPLGPLSGVPLTANRLYYVPVWLPTAGTYDAILFEVSSGTTDAATVVHAALYAHRSGFLPDRLRSTVAVTGAVPTGFKAFGIPPVTVERPGWHWASVVSTTAISLIGSTVADNLPSFRGGMAGATGRQKVLMTSQLLTTGFTTLPDPAASGSLADTYLHIGVRMV